jgi:hypothetical protein
VLLTLSGESQALKAAGEHPECVHISCGKTNGWSSVCSPYKSTTEKNADHRKEKRSVRIDNLSLFLKTFSKNSSINGKKKRYAVNIWESLIYQ